MSWKHALTIVLLLLPVAGITAFGQSSTESFNPSTGMMDVDYSGYLSKHDIIYNKPITTPVWGATVGNGRVGAMVWSANGLTMQVGGVDTSQQTAFSGGMLNLYTNPAMDSAFSQYQQRLSLYNGTLATTYDANRTVTIMGSPNSEVMGIHVSDSRTNVTSVTLDLSIWNVSQVTGGSVSNLTTWRTVSTYADSTGIGLSRGQVDPDNFGYTLAATVSGTSFTTQTVNSNTVRLVIKPASSYTIWFVCASRLNAPNHDSVTAAHNLLANAVSTGYDTTLVNFQDWWHAFWAKFFVQYSNSSGDADYMENMYYLYNYIIACGSYANYPFHFINADFSAVQDQHAQKWGYGYWYWNERDVYNSFFASNHPEVIEGLNNLYVRNLSTLESFTKTRYGFNGVWVPETIGWNGNANGTINSSFTKDILSSGTEAAQNMYLVYKYTGDTTYLANVAYPFMRQIAIFYTNKLSRNASGKYFMAVSNSHETYWEVQDAITDLAAIRSLFPEVISTANQLGLDSSLVPQWQNVLNNLVPYPSNGTSYLPNDPPAAPTHNDENVVSELLWPYGVTGIGSPDYSLINSAWVNRPFPYNNVWAPDAIQAARLGLGDASYAGMRAMLEIYQNYPNGRTNNTNGEFEYTGVHLSAMNEQLLQSYNDVIRVFPAKPSDSSFVSSFTLAARDGFLVSSERDSSGIKYVGIKSLLGNTANIFNPWGTQQVDVRNVSSGQVVLTTSNTQFGFATTADTVYIVERVAVPFSSYSHMQLTGLLNDNAKIFDGGANQLGLFAGAPPDTGKYQAEKAVLNNCIVSNDFAASGGAEVTNMSTGSSVTFNNVRAGKQLIIGYSTMSNPGKLGLYINGALNQVVTFPTTNSWSGVYSAVTLNINIPPGASIKLQNDPGDAGTNLDYIQVPGGGGSTTEGPFGGTPAAIPGTIQAENYDVGGQGTAYNVNSVNGTGNSYRSDGVDLESTSDTGGGLDLGWTGTGQWFRYTVNVASAGVYTVSFRVAAPTAVTDAFHLSNSSGANLSGAVNIPATGGFQTWTTVKANVTLPAGQQVLTLNEDNGGWNINYTLFALPSSSEGPFGGTPAAVPGTVQAENYDVGGQGVAYHVNAVNGTANSYRADGVDLETTTDTGGGFNLGWTGAGQWFRYTVNVASAGVYTVSFRVAAPTAAAGAFHLSSSSGANLSGSINVPATGGWQTWTTVTANVTLPAGQQVLTLNEDNGGWNINYLVFAGPGTGAAPSWVTAWTVAPSVHALGSGGDGGLVFNQQTEREVLHTTVGGNSTRIHLSNQYGAASLSIGGVHIAQSGSGSSINAGTDQVVTFGGSQSITIPAGGTVVSDSINFAAPGLQNVAVSIFFPSNGAITRTTSHQFTEQTNYFASGNVSGSATLSNAGQTGNYYFLTGIDVQNPALSASVVTLGASITAGFASTNNANHRWPDLLAQRLNNAGMVLGVANMGIAGNKLLSDNGEFGVSAQNRFIRDVLSQAGVKYVIFSDDPINDLGGNPSLPLSQFTQAYQSLINQAHAQGIKFYCSTLTPYQGSSAWTAQGETTREQINSFIRSATSPCDGVIDQDAATHNPSNPTMYLPAFDSGDHLHPNDAGYQAIANAINLSLFSAN